MSFNVSFNIGFSPVFYKPLSFFLIICSGYLLKKKGFFRKDDYKLLSKIVLTFTMPCAVIGTFAGFERDVSLFWIVLLGFLCSLIPMLVVYLLSFRQEKIRRIFSMINTSGYAIGSFTLPLIQGFYGAYSGVITCMFDTGNAVMMTGGAYAITSSLLHLEDDEDAGEKDRREDGKKDGQEDQQENEPENKWENGPKQGQEKEWKNRLKRGQEKKWKSRPERGREKEWKNGQKKRQQWKGILKKFVTSVPFDTYMLMLLMTALNIPVPELAAGIAAPVGAANPYLAMLVVGMMYEPPKDASYLKDSVVVLVRRLIFSAVFGLLLFFCTPFSLEVRRTLVVVAFSPVSTLAPIYTEKCHGDGALSSFANAISIVFALFVMSGLVYVMGS